MTLTRRWARDGFALLPGHLSPEDLTAARAELPTLFPTADQFHDDTDAARNARYRLDEFSGIADFPFAGVELSLLALHPRLVALAEALLGTADIRLYSSEAWAKYTGAADYDQPLHRDYLNHTLMVPSRDPAFEQVELFLYLVDVPDELGPPHFVSQQVTGDAPALPNWLSRHERPEWYAAEVSGAGPAGTVVAYSIATFHRGTALTLPRGARYTIHASYRRASAEWAARMSWVYRSFEPAWNALIPRASVRQLQLLGFPPPGHPYWTDETLAGMALRYPQLDLTPFRGNAPAP